MKRRGLLLALAAVLIVALVGGAWWALSRPPRVEDAAERYLTALAAGDYPAIAAMSDSGLDAAAEATLADAFAGASYGTAPEVEEIVPSDGFTGVRASMELGGDRRGVFFGMALRDGEWTLASDYLAVLEVSTGIGDSVWVGGALVPVGEVALLPAVYPVSPAPRTVLTGGTDVAVSNDEPTSVEVDAALAGDADAQAQAQLDAYLDACTTPAATVPHSCGIRIPWAADLATLEGLAYRIEQRPAVALSPGDGTFSATGGILIVTATGTTHGGVPGGYTYRAEDWALYGTLRFTGDELVLAVR